MTVRASCVPDVLDWLLANLPDITGVQVIEGAPGQNAKKDRVEIMGATSDQEYRAGSARSPGGPKRTEEATVDLVVHSVKAGQDTTAARRRVDEIVASIAEHLVSDPMRTLNLGGIVCWAQLVPHELAYSVSAEPGRGAHMHCQLFLHEMR